MNFLIALCFALIVIIFIVFLIRLFSEHNTMISDFGDDQSTVTTTTTTTVDTATNPSNFPQLRKQYKSNGQPFCVDPVDGIEWLLNTTDDCYEDANGVWWKLVEAA